MHFVSGSTHQTVNFHTGTPFSRVKGLIYQVGAANETSGQPCSANTFLDGVLDIKTPMQTPLSVFLGKTTALFHLHGSDYGGADSFITVSFESVHITTCTECKTVTATLIHADHFNSVAPATDVHSHERYLTFLPPNPCSHTHLQS